MSIKRLLGKILTTMCLSLLLRIHGISKGIPLAKLSLHMDHEIAGVGLTHPDGQPVKSTELIDVIDEVGLGYSSTTDSQLSEH